MRLRQLAYCWKGFPENTFQERNFSPDSNGANKPLKRTSCMNVNLHMIVMLLL